MLSIFIALIPALLTAVLAVVSYGLPQLANAIRAFMATPERVEIVKDFLVNLAFIGSAAGVFLGIQEDEVHMLPFSLFWLLGFYWAADMTANLLAALRTEQEKIAHRKMAGTVRSIVRSELVAAQAKQAEEGVETQNS